MTPDPTSSSSPIPQLTPTSPEPTKAAGAEVTLTGTVEHIEIEGGCTVLRVEAGKAYELMGGDPNVLKVGTRVTVKGKVRTDMVTICQVGPVLQVISSQPA